MAIPKFKSITSLGLGTAGTSITPTIPSSPAMAAGDLMIMWVNIKAPTAGSTNTPAGWTKTPGEKANGNVLVVYYRFWQVGDTNPQVTWTTSSKASGGIAVYTGVATVANGGPYDAASVSNSGTGTTATASSITAATKGALLVNVTGNAVTGAGGSINWRMTQRALVSSSGGSSNTRETSQLSDQPYFAACPTGSRDYGVTSGNWCAWSLILKPATASSFGRRQFERGNMGGTGSLTVSFPAALTSGKLVVAYVVTDNTVGGRVNAVKIGTSTAMTQAGSDVTTHSQTISIWYKENNTDTATGVTATRVSGVGQMNMIVAEYDGAITSSALDKTGTNTGTSASLSVTSAVPANQTELAVNTVASNNLTNNITADAAYLALAPMETSATASFLAVDGEKATGGSAVTVTDTAAGSEDFAAFIALFSSAARATYIDAAAAASMALTVTGVSQDIVPAAATASMALTVTGVLQDIVPAAATASMALTVGGVAGIKYRDAVASASLALSAEGGGYVVGRPISTLTDNFDDNGIGPLWGGNTDSGSQITESGGRLSLMQLGGAYDSACYVLSGRYDFTDGEIFARLYQLLPGHLFTAGFGICKYVVDTNWYAAPGAFIIYDYDAHTLSFVWQAQGGARTVIGTPVTYNAAVHKWVKIAHVAGQFLAYTSVNGLTWTQPNVDWAMDLTGRLNEEEIAWAQVYIGTRLIANGDESTVYWDNFNIAPTVIGGAAAADLTAAVSAVGEVIVPAAASASLSLSAGGYAADPNTIVWVSDTHAATSDPGATWMSAAELAALAAEINTVMPEAVLHTGDTRSRVGNDGDAGVFNDNFYSQVIAPIKIVRGNHDSDADSYPLAYTGFDAIFPSVPYHDSYDWEGPQLRFIMFHADRQVDGTFALPAGEETWLEGQVSSMSAGWRAVLMSHAPVWGDAPGAGTDHSGFISPAGGRTTLLAFVMANAQKIAAYLCGHQHQPLYSDPHYGTHHVWGPSAAVLGNDAYTRLTYDPDTGVVTLSSYYATTSFSARSVESFVPVSVTGETAPPMPINVRVMGADVHDLSVLSSNGGAVSYDGTVSDPLVGASAGSIKYDTAASASCWTTLTPVLSDRGRRIVQRHRLGAFPNAGKFMFLTNMKDGSNNRMTALSVDSSGHVGLSQTSTANYASGTGTTPIELNEWFTVALCYRIVDATHNSFRIYLNGNLEVSLDDITLAYTTGSVTTDVGYTNAGQAGANKTSWCSSCYIDDGGDPANLLDDPGQIVATFKRYTGTSEDASNNAFDTAIGSARSMGSRYLNVSEVPPSNTNGWRQAGTTRVYEKYLLEASSAGDLNISTRSVLAQMAWVRASAAATSFGFIVDDDKDTYVDLTSTVTHLYRCRPVGAYPTGRFGIRSTGTATDTNLYEGGVHIAYLYTEAAYIDAVSAVEVALSAQGAADIVVPGAAAPSLELDAAATCDVLVPGAAAATIELGAAVAGEGVWPASATSAMSLSAAAAAEVVVPAIAAPTIALSAGGAGELLWPAVAADEVALSSTIAGDVLVPGVAGIPLLLSVEGVGSLGQAGAASFDLAATFEGVAEVLVGASASAPVNLAATGGAGVLVPATATAATVLSVEGVGSLKLAGVASASLELAVTASAEVVVPATATAATVLSVEGVGSLKLAGAAALTLEVSATAAGDVLVPGAAAAPVALSAEGVASLKHAASATLSLEAGLVAAAEVVVPAAAALSVELTLTGVAGRVLFGQAALPLQLEVEGRTSSVVGAAAHVALELSTEGASQLVALASAGLSVALTVTPYPAVVVQGAAAGALQSTLSSVADAIVPAAGQVAITLSASIAPAQFVEAAASASLGLAVEAQVVVIVSASALTALIMGVGETIASVIVPASSSVALGASVVGVPLIVTLAAAEVALHFTLVGGVEAYEARVPLTLSVAAGAVVVIPAQMRAAMLITAKVTRYIPAGVVVQLRGGVAPRSTLSGGVVRAATIAGAVPSPQEISGAVQATTCLVGGVVERVNII